MCVKKIEFITKDASDIENCGLINRFIFRQPLEIVFVFQLQEFARSESMKCGIYTNIHKWKCKIKFTWNDASEIDDVWRLQHQKVYKVMLQKLQKFVTKLKVNNVREENWIYCKRCFWYWKLWLDKQIYLPTTSRNCFCFPTPIIARSESINAECTRMSTNENAQSNSHWMMLLILMMF